MWRNNKHVRFKLSFHVYFPWGQLLPIPPCCLIPSSFWRFLNRVHVRSDVCYGPHHPKNNWQQRVYYNSERFAMKSRLKLINKWQIVHSWERYSYEKNGSGTWSSTINIYNPCRAGWMMWQAAVVIEWMKRLSANHLTVMPFLVWPMLLLQLILPPSLPRRRVQRRRRGRRTASQQAIVSYWIKLLLWTSN